MATEGASVKPQRQAVRRAAEGHYDRRLVQVQCKAGTDYYSLAVHDGMVVLMPHDPRDSFQVWIKDGRFGDKVKDAQGGRSFALVNEATGMAIRHATGASRPVQLVPYNHEFYDETVLWTEGKGEDYRAIRLVNDLKLNLGALLDGDRGVRNGTLIGLTEWKDGDYQLWQITNDC